MASGLRQRTRCHTVSFSRQGEEIAVVTDKEDRGSQTEERGMEVVSEADVPSVDNSQPPRTLEECVAVMKSEVRNTPIPLGISHPTLLVGSRVHGILV